MSASVAPLSFGASMRLPLVRSALEEIAPESVIEVGCGMGAMATRLAQAYTYRGYEPDQLSYSTAARRLAGSPRGTVLNEPLPEAPDRLFGVLCAFEVLEHIEDDFAAMRTWVDWVEPGGGVIVSVPSGPHRFGSSDRFVGHFRRYSRDRLSRAMEEAGLEVRSISTWGMPLGYLIEAMRNWRLERPGGEGHSSAAGTPGSGRLFQPTGYRGLARGVMAWPFTQMQRPFISSDLGVGYVALGRKAG